MSGAVQEEIATWEDALDQMVALGMPRDVARSILFTQYYGMSEQRLRREYPGFFVALRPG